MATPYTPKFNFPNNKLYQYEGYPVLVNCNFVVDVSNGNGLGIRNLKGAGVPNVFMHTTATPGVGSHGFLNPNPAPGVILLQLDNQYNRLLQIFGGQISPVAGSALTAV